MSGTTNKIKYGLKNVHYAVATIAADNTATFDTPVPIPGAVNLSMEPQGERSVFNADNVEYFVSASNNGYEGDLEIALVPEDFETDIFGAVEDTKNVLFEDTDAPTVHFALLFQFEGDVKATKHVFYNCTATRSNVEGETKGESVEPKTETLSLAAKPVHFANINKNVCKGRTKEDTDATTYSGWFEAVYTPTAL